jgi:hypothetical protein
MQTKSAKLKKDASEVEVREYFTNGDVHQKIEALQHPSMDIETLWNVAKMSDSYNLRAAVAANRNASPDILLKLGNDDSHIVIANVIMNPKTPISFLEKAVKNHVNLVESFDSVMVAGELARCERMPPKSLVEFARKTQYTQVIPYAVENLAKRLLRKS